jgi:hypothetical protein
MAPIPIPPPINLTSTELRDIAPHWSLLPYITTFFIVTLALFILAGMSMALWVAENTLPCKFRYLCQLHQMLILRPGPRCTEHTPDMSEKELQPNKRVYSKQDLYSALFRQGVTVLFLAGTCILFVWHVNGREKWLTESLLFLIEERERESIGR